MAVGSLLRVNAASHRPILVVGLDSAAPDLVFERWGADLPTIERLRASGTWARLESTVPAITVPAWSSMMTGCDPGQLGFYGFRNRKDWSYDGLSIATSRAVARPRVWNVLGDAGRRVGVIGVPQTYPVQPVHGDLVSCFLTPGPDSEFTFPAELKREIANWIDGEFLLDVPDFRSEDTARILRDIYRLAEQHFVVCHRLLERGRYDFFMTVDMGLDRIQHAFWRFMDPLHPRYEPESEFATAIHDYYVFLDGEIARLLDRVPDDTVVVVVSDHGAKRMVGGICVNEWLIQEGFLVLEEQPDGPLPLGRARIDWSRTRAWAEGGYYGRVFLNVAGREPSGTIEPDMYEKTRTEIAKGLEGLGDPEGRPIGTVAYRPEDVFVEVRNVPPDLIVYFGDLDWRSVGSVGLGSVWTFENDTGPDFANHAQQGIFVIADPARPGLGDVGAVSIYDVGPSLLALAGADVPAGVRGRPLRLF